MAVATWHELVDADGVRLLPDRLIGPANHDPQVDGIGRA